MNISLKDAILDDVPYIGHKEDAHDFMVTDDDPILTGWRINFNSHCKALKSIFMLHNETVNIWSHMLGSLAVLCVIFWVAYHDHHSDLPMWPLFT